MSGGGAGRYVSKNGQCVSRVSSMSGFILFTKRSLHSLAETRKRQGGVGKETAHAISYVGLTHSSVYCFLLVPSQPAMHTECTEKEIETEFAGVFCV